MKKNISICMLRAGLAVAVAIALQGFPSLALVLPVSQCDQEQDQWCWAATSQSILAYYGTNLTQAEIAQYGTQGANIPNFLYGSDVNPTRNGVDLILDHFLDIASTPYDRALSLNEVSSDIDSDMKPVAIRWGWDTGGGHILVLHGLSNNTAYLMDPWDGATITTFSWVSNGSSHTWTHSLSLDTSPPPGNTNYTLTIRATGGANPTTLITFSPKDLSGVSGYFINGNGGSANAPFSPNQAVTLTAPATSGATIFSTWSGVDSQSGRIATAIMNRNRPVTAIYVDAAALPGSDLSIYSKGWDDTRGNGDEDDVMEGWEDVDLILWLKSTANIQDVRGSLSSSLGALNISDAEEYWPDISANDNERCNANFDMFLNQDSYSSIPFTLRVDYEKNGLPYYQNLTFTKSFHRNGTNNADFDVVGVTIDDSTAMSVRNNGDGLLQSGERAHLLVTFRNTGNADASDAKASICSSNLSAIIDVCETETLGDVGKGHTVGPESYLIDYVSKAISTNLCLDVFFTWDQKTNGVLKTCEIPLTIHPLAWLEMPEEAYDFGLAIPGSLITHTTLVKNVGSTSLQITNITTTATDTTWIGAPLPWTLQPGQSTNLVVRINTTNLQGAITRVVSVKSTGRVHHPGQDDQLIISGIVSASVPVYTIASTTNVSCSDPDISGEWIVWADNRNGNSDIFAFNTTTLQEIAVCVDQAPQYRPRVSNGLVVWRDYRNDPLLQTNCDIYGFDLNAPQLGVFPVSSNIADEVIIGVDGNLVAFARLYEVLFSSSTPRQVYNMIVCRYDGNKQFSHVYTTGWTPGSGTATRPSVSTSSTDCDLGGQLLLYQQYDRYHYVRNDGTTQWSIGNTQTRVIDFSKTTPAPVIVNNTSTPDVCAGSKRFTYRDTDGNGDTQVFMWKDGAGASQVTFIAEYGPGDDCSAFGGPAGQELLLYDYGDATARPGLYALDRANGNLESVVSFSDDPVDVRMDGYSAVWVGDRIPNSPIKYAFFKQSDIAISSASLSVTPNPLNEGQHFTLVGTVRNLAPTPCASLITVRAYNGNPNAGGQQIGTDLVIGGGLAAMANQVMTFTNLGPLSDGQHQIYVKASTSAADYSGNNVAVISVTVEDSDINGPQITSSIVTEVNGDGDGIIGTDEDAQLNLTLSDPSGVGNIQVLLNGVQKPVSGPLTNCSAALGKLSAVQHNLEVRATDADITPSSRTNFSTFVVVSAERIAVSFNAIAITNSQTQPVDLGVHEIGSVPSPIFIVENSGQQHLTITNISVTGSFSSSGPLTSEVQPSGLTSFIIRPETTSVGSHTGMVTIASSDPLKPLFRFPVIAKIPPTLRLLIRDNVANPKEIYCRVPVGWTCLVQASTNLVNWLSLYQTTSSSNLVTFSDTGSMNESSRFYRAIGYSSPSEAPHPADLNADFVISALERNNYAVSYIMRSVWPIPPSPIPVAYRDKADQILQSGPAYQVNTSLPPPDCWIVAP